MLSVTQNTMLSGFIRLQLPDIWPVFRRCSGLHTHHHTGPQVFVISINSFTLLESVGIGYTQNARLDRGLRDSSWDPHCPSLAPVPANKRGLKTAAMPPTNTKQPGGRTADSAASKAMERAPRLGEVPADNYRLVREIGRGAMGAVYLAEDPALERQVAIKVPAPEHAVHPGQAALFRREARLLAAVRHENVVHVHTLGEHRGVPYMVMGIVGPTLASYLVQAVRVHDAIPLDLAVSLALQLCRAVQVVHAAGIIHRDIKPANVMVAPGPRAIP